METGSNYVRARVYKPTIARWWSQDPITFRESVFRWRDHLRYMDGLNLYSDLIPYIDGMSLYAYAKSNPLSYTDPTGLFVPIIPIVIGASCAACWRTAGAFFNTAHNICSNSKNEADYLLYFISTIEETESILDWYTWSVINSACLACGGGLTGAAKRIAQKMAGKWGKKKAAKEAMKEAAEKAAKEKAEKCALCFTLKKTKKEACNKARGMSCTNSFGNCLPLSDEVFMLRGTLLSACASARSAHQKVCFHKDDPLAPGHWKQIADQARAATNCFTCAYRN